MCRRTDIEIDEKVMREAQRLAGAATKTLIEAGEPVALTDVICAEVLQGLRSDEEARLVEHHLRAFPILRLGGFDDFALAAGLYRDARAQGVTIRASPTIERR